MAKRPKRPRDVNQLGKFIIDHATGQLPPDPPVKPKNEAAAALSKLGAAKGGEARAAKLSPHKRKAIAKKAAKARWRTKS